MCLQFCYRAARKEGGNPDKSMKLICLFFAPEHPYCPLSISDSSLLLHLLIPDDVLGSVCSLFQTQQFSYQTAAMGRLLSDCVRYFLAVSFLSIIVCSLHCSLPHGLHQNNICSSSIMDLSKYGLAAEGEELLHVELDAAG